MALNVYINKKVTVLTTEGRCLVGVLISCDQQTNLVLEECVERVIRPREDDKGSLIEPIGTYLIRGDQVAICGRVDEEMDASIDWEKVRGDAIGTTRH